MKSLRRLTELLLHDNDISMIDDGALALHKDLGRFTIEGNGGAMIRTFDVDTVGAGGKLVGENVVGLVTAWYFIEKFLEFNK